MFTLESRSCAPEQQVFRGCLHTGNSSKGAPCRPPASYVSAANSALDLDLFPSALHSQASRRALFAPALPFPIRRMQTIEKRRCLGCVFCILMYPLRFSSERKRVCMADGNDSDRCKTARRLTVRPPVLVLLCRQRRLHDLSVIHLVNNIAPRDRPQPVRNDHQRLLPMKALNCLHNRRFRIGIQCTRCLI